MSCITANIAGQCEEEVMGGLVQTAVGEIADVQAWTEDANGNVTAISMKTGKKMWTIDWEEETADYNADPLEAQAGSRNYQVGYAHLVDGNLLGQEGQTLKKLDEYAKCRCGLFLINVYNSGDMLIAGLRYRKDDVVGTPNKLAKFIAKTGSKSGKQVTNLKITNVKFDAKTAIPPQNFLGTIPLVAAS